MEAWITQYFLDARSILTQVFLGLALVGFAAGFGIVLLAVRERG